MAADVGQYQRAIAAVLGTCSDAIRVVSFSPPRPKPRSCVGARHARHADLIRRRFRDAAASTIAAGTL